MAVYPLWDTPPLDWVFTGNNPSFERRKTEAEGLAPVDFDPSIKRRSLVMGLAEDTADDLPITDDLEIITPSAWDGAVLGLVAILADSIEPHRDFLTIHWGTFWMRGKNPLPVGRGQ